MVARAVRIDVNRVRLVQILIFICLAAGPIARRLMVLPALAGAGALLLIRMIVFVSARRSFGHQASSASD